MQRRRGERDQSWEESPAGVAGLGSTRVDSSYRGGGLEKGGLEQRPEGRRERPRDCTGSGGGKLAGSPRQAQKKPGPPCGRPGLDWDDSCEPSLNPHDDRPMPQGRHAKDDRPTIQVPTAAGAAGASVGTATGATSVGTPSEITLAPLQSPFGQPPETAPPSTPYSAEAPPQLEQPLETAPPSTISLPPQLEQPLEAGAESPQLEQPLEAGAASPQLPQPLSAAGAAPWQPREAFLAWSLARRPTRFLPWQLAAAAGAGAASQPESQAGAASAAAAPWQPFLAWSLASRPPWQDFRP